MKRQRREESIVSVLFAAAFFHNVFGGMCRLRRGGKGSQI
ncbi:hypothetical protein HMPREF9555_00883 [Selenomonas artemidis F0399]|uniref:Uncharacterized protein n=1 Tax=Selenomonas artemidis F0399 TaxID=749551 RepID=E7N1P9_9FIRM|nr:hypothetical protein HMPREF9555_00883 [Selenomonas artemidis F0399]